MHKYSVCAIISGIKALRNGADMEPKQIFIDGRAGTTGLRIAERLAARTDVRLLTLPEQSRKDPAARREALNAADIFPSDPDVSG